MHSKSWWVSGALSAAALTLSGCASTKPVAVACPQFQPSPEALQPIQGTGWRTLGERVVETYRSSDGISSGRSR